jgi:hypothetical protein
MHARGSGVGGGANSSVVTVGDPSECHRAAAHDDASARPVAAASPRPRFIPTCAVIGFEIDDAVAIGKSSADVAVAIVAVVVYVAGVVAALSRVRARICAATVAAVPRQNATVSAHALTCAIFDAGVTSTRVVADGAAPGAAAAEGHASTVAYAIATQTLVVVTAANNNTTIIIAVAAVAAACGVAARVELKQNSVGARHLLCIKHEMMCA